MPIPASFTDLDPNPNNNSPQGTENVGPNANGYIQALAAFIAQLHNGTLKPTATVDFNAQKITNLLAGSTTSTSTDALTGAQVRALAYKVGEVRTWHGAVASITATWGAGWQLADGTNGTADLRDRFIVGAGLTYAVNGTGGNSTNVLTTLQLPAHNHGVNETPHTHTAIVTDPGHAHVGDPRIFYNAGGIGFAVSGTGTNCTLQSNVPSFASATGISVSNSSVSTGITTQNTGTGASVENKPPYYALVFIEYTGIGS